MTFPTRRAVLGLAFSTSLLAGCARQSGVVDAGQYDAFWLWAGTRPQPVLDKALKTVPDALVVLKDQRNQLADALVQLGRFSALAADSVNQTKESLVQELRDLGPTLKALADAGPSLTRALSLYPTFPWPKETLDNWMRGDYGNLSLIFDLTLSRVDSGLFTGTRWEGDLTELELQWGRTIGQLPSPYTHSNPLIVPYHWDQGR